MQTPSDFSAPERGCVVLDQPQHAGRDIQLRILTAGGQVNSYRVFVSYGLRLVEDDTAALRFFLREKWTDRMRFDT